MDTLSRPRDLALGVANEDLYGLAINKNMHARIVLAMEKLTKTMNDSATLNRLPTVLGYIGNKPNETVRVGTVVDPPECHSTKNHRIPTFGISFDVPRHRLNVSIFQCVLQSRGLVERVGTSKADEVLLSVLRLFRALHSLKEHCLQTADSAARQTSLCQKASKESKSKPLNHLLTQDQSKETLASRLRSFQSTCSFVSAQLESWHACSGARRQ